MIYLEISLEMRCICKFRKLVDLVKATSHNKMIINIKNKMNIMIKMLMSRRITIKAEILSSILIQLIKTKRDIQITEIKLMMDREILYQAQRFQK